MLLPSRLAARGKNRWTYGAGITDGGSGTPIIGRDGTLYCNMARSLHAVSRGGKRLSSFSYGDLEFFGSPTLAADGRRKWSMYAKPSGGGDGSSIGRDGRLYFFADYGALRAVEGCRRAESLNRRRAS